MRILFCHDGPLKKDEDNNYYGTAHNDKTFKRYYNIADELAVAIRVNNISESEAKRKFSKITVTPFEVVECPNVSSFKGMLLERNLTKQILKEAVLKSDYVVARLPSLIGFIGIDLARKLNKPYFVEVVACSWDAYWNHSFKGKLVAPLMYLSTKRRVKNSSYTLYVTNQFLQKRYPTNGISIGISDVSLPNFDENVLEKRLNKIKENNKKIILGTTAAVNVRYKGQQYIIEALGKLKEMGINNLEYQLVGGGDDSYLKSIAEKYHVTDQVKFLGTKPHHEVFDWLDSIDIYVQPSRQEGLPRAVIEAMSRGLPCFGAETGGIPELLDTSFIFSNTRKNIDEICKIILSYNKRVMIEQAKRNFNEAKKYQENIIEEKRNAFYRKFVTNK